MAPLVYKCAAKEVWEHALVHDTTDRPPPALRFIDIP